MKRALPWLWLIAIFVIATIAGLALVYSIVHSGYDEQLNRAPVGRIVLAAGASVAGLAALLATYARVVVRSVGPPLVNWWTSIVLGVLTAALIVAWGLVTIDSGPTRSQPQPQSAEVIAPSGPQRTAAATARPA